MKIDYYDIVTICGLRGSGKSTLTSNLIRKNINNYDKIFVIDPLLEHNYEFKNVSVIKLSLLLDNAIEYFNEILRKLILIKQKLVNEKWLIVIDEADRFFINRKNLSIFQKFIIEYGRHWNMSIIFVTRRLAMLHTNCVAQSSKVFIFKLFSSADKNYLANCGLDHLIPYIEQLKKYECILYNVYEPSSIIKTNSKLA